ncbi:hypothetical protein COO60DRAFT_1491054 [Scenedesmus sp. NREL 46B-D3]|nr:hypothetical protein COO60DRAFT_1491054 [Scenedesmus sp. NREL 46B-D3]
MQGRFCCCQHARLWQVMHTAVLLVRVLHIAGSADEQWASQGHVCWQHLPVFAHSPWVHAAVGLGLVQCAAAPGASLVSATYLCCYVQPCARRCVCCLLASTAVAAL